MDLIQCYIEAVARRLQPQRRSSAVKQLQELIDGKLNQRTGGQPSQDADIEAVLLELGDPALMADKIRGSARCLIGPDIFETYWLVVRIVLLAAGFGILVASVVRLATNPPEQAWPIMGEFLSGLWNALLGGFGMVTLIFALVEYFNPQARDQLKLKQKAWHPSQLPARPTSSLVIKRAEPVVAIIFMVVFLVIINLNLNLIGIYVPVDSSDYPVHIVPLLSDYFKTFIPWINIATAIAIFLEGIKLFTGRWTIPLVIGSLVQKTISLVISVRLFADTRLFDANFFPQLRFLLNQKENIVPADADARVCRVLLIITIAGFVLDALTTGWKAIKIATEKPNKP